MTSTMRTSLSAKWARSRFRGSLAGASTLALAVVLPAPGVDAADRKVNLNRSIYVPVEFVACPHVQNVTLSVVGEGPLFGPGKRTFLYTYYADREEVLPQSVDVRIQGDGLCNGRPFETNVLVTPEAIHWASGSRDFELESLRKKLRIHRDAHLPLRRILITCDHQCETAEAELKRTDDATASGDTKAASASAPNGRPR